MTLLSNVLGAKSKDELKALIKQGAFLVDVRTPEEFAEGCVPGSINIPVDQVAMNLDKFKEKENTIVFCRSGSRSGYAKNILEQNGLPNIINGGSWLDIKQLLEEE